jgi:hypothetical protein
MAAAVSCVSAAAAAAAAVGTPSLDDQSAVRHIKVLDLASIAVQRPNSHIL